MPDLNIYTRYILKYRKCKRIFYTKVGVSFMEETQRYYYRLIRSYLLYYVYVIYNRLKLKRCETIQVYVIMFLSR